MIYKGSIYLADQLAQVGAKTLPLGPKLHFYCCFQKYLKAICLQSLETEMVCTHQGETNVNILPTTHPRQEHADVKESVH